LQYLAGLDEQVLQQFGGSSRASDVREDQKQLSQVRSNVRISLVILTFFLSRWQPATLHKNDSFVLFMRAIKHWYLIHPMLKPCTSLYLLYPSFRKAQALRRQGAVYQAQDWLKSDAVREYAKGPDFDAEKARLAASISERERQSHAKWRGFLS